MPFIKLPDLIKMMMNYDKANLAEMVKSFVNFAENIKSLACSSIRIWMAYWIRNICADPVKEVQKEW